MNPRSSLFVLVAGFGTLLLLLGVFGFSAIHQTSTIHRGMQDAQEFHLQMGRFRRSIVTDIYLADILVRDYLLSSSTETTPRQLQETLTLRQSVHKRMDEFATLVPAADRPALDRLRAKIEEYWNSLDPIYTWTSEERDHLRWTFLAANVLPRRDAIIKLGRELGQLNDENLERERQRLEDAQRSLGVFLVRTIGAVFALGLIVAALTTQRVVALEKTRNAQRGEIEETQNNLRRLSQRLVQAQELERRALSRELHDEVGQMLTAVGIELGNLETIYKKGGAAFLETLEDARKVNTEAMMSLRSIAMGLRPSMLDDLGLQSALAWQGREFARRTGVAATVHVDAGLDDLPDEQRTCIYRVVQEALTNCARHARARNVSVAVRSEDGGIRVLIEDDGVGFESTASLDGLGLLGIQERVQALDGKIDIASTPQKGTTIQIQIPAGVAA